MNKQKFREIRLSLDLSVATCGKITGFAPRTIRDWENPKKPSTNPHPAAVTIMNQLISGWRPPEFKPRAWYGRTDASNLGKRKKK